MSSSPRLMGLHVASADADADEMASGDEDGVAQGTLSGAEILARGIPLNLDQE